MGLEARSATSILPPIWQIIISSFHSHLLVYSFGTEGRAGHPDKEIPPQPQVFPLIVFKGTDVKDLKVEENPQQMVVIRMLLMLRLLYY